jgi:hypothetical protein
MPTQGCSGAAAPPPLATPAGVSDTLQQATACSSSARALRVKSSERCVMPIRPGCRLSALVNTPRKGGRSRHSHAQARTSTASTAGTARADAATALPAGTRSRSCASLISSPPLAVLTRSARRSQASSVRAGALSPPQSRPRLRPPWRCCPAPRMWPRCTCWPPRPALPTRASLPCSLPLRAPWLPGSPLLPRPCAASLRPWLRLWRPGTCVRPRLGFASAAAATSLARLCAGMPAGAASWQRPTCRACRVTKERCRDLMTSLRAFVRTAALTNELATQQNGRRLHPSLADDQLAANESRPFKHRVSAHSACCSYYVCTAFCGQQTASLAAHLECRSSFRAGTAAFGFASVTLDPIRSMPK